MLLVLGGLQGRAVIRGSDVFFLMRVMCMCRLQYTLDCENAKCFASRSGF